jgi:Osmosensitive K+ channel histidine kinase
MVVRALHTKSQLRARSAWRDVLISVAILAACSLIGFVFYSFQLSEANIISIYIIGILLIASITSSWIYGTASSICGVLLFNFLYADPIFNFYVYDLQYSITTVVMLVASLITNYIMVRFCSQLDREKLEIRRLDILLETSQELQLAQNEDDIFNVALLQLYQMFERSIVIFPVSQGVMQTPRIKLSEYEADFSFDVFGLDNSLLQEFIHAENEGKSICIRLASGKKAVCFKLMSAESLFAVICIIVDSGKDIVGFEYNLVLAMLDDIALFLEKHHLHLFNERIAREAEAERLRTNLLRTISHDLRTPLTSISGNADILLSNENQIGPELRKQLYQNIYSDSEWLINLVENLLFITRIDNGVMSINTEYEILQEIIHEALHCTAKRTKGHNLSIEMPDELLMVKTDVRLFIQVIVNILDNAIKYTPAGSDIAIRAFRQDSLAVVEIADTGCGIRDEDKLKVFEMFYTTNKQSSDSRRGIGLGLPLCRSIIHAHGGTIHIADNVPNGVIVHVALRLEEVCGE